jgi:predicted transcriptional regulator
MKVQNLEKHLISCGMMVLPVSFRRYHRGELGPLEKRVMLAIWRRGSATVQELRVFEGFRLAHQTVMTTMKRLYNKGILDRVRVSPGRTFRYTPLYAQGQLEMKKASEAINEALAAHDSKELLISRLVEVVAERDEQLLDELARMVEEKRRTLRKVTPTKPRK